MFWLFFLEHLYSEDDVYLLAGDEVVISKAGKQTYGVDRFNSCLSDKSIPGLAFFTLSLVSTKGRHSFPIRIEQVIKEKVEKLAMTKLPENKASQQKTKKVTKNTLSPTPNVDKKNKGGRPKGSKTKDKANVTLTPELLHLRYGNCVTRINWFQNTA